MSIAQLERSTVDHIVYTNSTGASIAAGTPIVIEEAGSNLLGVAAILLNALADGESGTAYILGEFRIDKAAVAFAQGQKVYYDVSATNANNAANAATDGDFVLGVCSKAAASGDDYVQFLLNFGPGANTVVS